MNILKDVRLKEFCKANRIDIRKLGRCQVEQDDCIYHIKKKQNTVLKVNLTNDKMYIIMTDNTPLVQKVNYG